MTNEVGGSFDALSFSPGAVIGYVITCADNSGSFEWADPTGFSVTSVQGTNKQVYANGTYGSQQTGDIILTLPQDIAVDSQPQFSRLYLTNNSTNTILQLYNASGNNYHIFNRGKILNTFEVAGQQIYYGLNSASAIYTLLTNYTYCNTNTSGNETASTFWESIENGSQLQVFGFIGNNVYLPQLTANSYAYLNANKYLTSRSSSDFKTDVLSCLSATLPIADTAGVFSLNYGGNLRLNGSNLDTIANPTFSNSTFSGISASQYVKTDALKALTTVASIPIADVTGLSANLPTLYAAGVISLNYTSNLQLSGSSLDTIQDIKIGSTPTFVNTILSGLSASQYVKTDSKKQLTTVATIPASDITGLSASLPIAFSAGNIVLNYTSNLQLTGSSLDTIQDIKVSSSPTFVNLTLSGLTASQYVKTNGSKLLVSASTIPITDVTGLSGTLPISYSAGAISLGYNTTNLRLNASQLDTIQRIDTLAYPQFSSLLLDGGVLNSVNSISNSNLGVSNFNTATKYKTGGLAAFDLVLQEVRYGSNSTGGLFTAGTNYTYANSSTAGSESASTIWESISAGTSSQIFGFIGREVYFPLKTASTMLYADANKYLQSASIGTSLSFSGGSLNTIQDIRTSATPVFGKLNLNNSSSSNDTILQMINDQNAYNNYVLIFKNKTGGLSSLQNIAQHISYGMNSSNSYYVGFTYYTQNISSTAGNEYSQTLFESCNAGVSTPVFGLIQNQFYLPVQTANTLTYLDGSKYLKSATTGTSLSLSSGTINTIQDIRTSATPSFTGCNLSSLTASTYLYADGSKNITSRSAANFAADVAAAIPTLEGKTYTPTINNLSRINAASGIQGVYTRIGNIVQFSGYFLSSTNTTVSALQFIGFDISIPLNNSGSWTNTDQVFGSTLCYSVIGSSNICFDQQFYYTLNNNAVSVTCSPPSNLASGVPFSCKFMLTYNLF